LPQSAFEVFFWAAIIASVLKGLFGSRRS
jgi:hypothetical protein